MKKNYGTIPLKSGVLIKYDFDFVLWKILEKRLSGKSDMIN